MAHTIRRSLVALACGCAVLAPLATRLPAAAPIVILFVGNSFFHGAFQPVRSYGADTVTDENAAVAAGSPRSEGRVGPYGGIPAIFKKLTAGAGLDYDVHSELVSGKSLEFHYTNALDVIAQAKWNVVVMHGYSTEPVPAARTGKPDSFTKYADLLEAAVHHANAATEIYLYETWSRADLTYRASGPYHDEPIEAMGHDLHDGYYGEFAHNGHFKGLAPAGDAWLRAITDGVAEADPTHPDATKINLWAVDSYHPSIYGAYLNALVLLDEITNKDPRALGGSEQAAADLKIPSATAIALQRIAYEQVEAGHRVH
jgi:hypothetical protein